jgi:hypothetical protein
VGPEDPRVVGRVRSTACLKRATVPGTARRPVAAVSAAALLFLSAAVVGCRASPRSDAPLYLTAGAQGPDTRVTLHAAPHLKINARLAPALELAGGTVLRFGGAPLTADSAYFSQPPSALLTGRHEEVHGTLRASVCRDDEQVCRSLTLEL